MYIHTPLCWHKLCQNYRNQGYIKVIRLFLKSTFNIKYPHTTDWEEAAAWWKIISTVDSCCFLRQFCGLTPLRNQLRTDSGLIIHAFIVNFCPCIFWQGCLRWTLPSSKGPFPLHVWTVCVPPFAGPSAVSGKLL